MVITKIYYLGYMNIEIVYSCSKNQFSTPTDYNDIDCLNITNYINMVFIGEELNSMDKSIMSLAIL